MNWMWGVGKGGSKAAPSSGLRNQRDRSVLDCDGEVVGRAGLEGRGNEGVGFGPSNSVLQLRLWVAEGQGS